MIRRLISHAGYILAVVVLAYWRERWLENLLVLEASTSRVYPLLFWSRGVDLTQDGSLAKPVSLSRGFTSGLWPSATSRDEARQGDLVGQFQEYEVYDQTIPLLALARREQLLVSLYAHITWHFLVVLTPLLFPHLQEPVSLLFCSFSLSRKCTHFLQAFVTIFFFLGLFFSRLLNK